MGFLLFLGLTGMLFGTALRMQGAANQQQAEAQLLEEELPVYESQQAAIKAQQAEVGQDILAAGKIYGIEQQALGIKGFETARAGRQTLGQVSARAGAGNLAGSSILRQALSVQRATERQMTLITGEKQKMEIEYADTLREFDIKKMQLSTNLLTSEVTEQQTREKAEFIRKYGWMEVAGIGLQGVGSMIGMGLGV